MNLTVTHVTHQDEVVLANDGPHQLATGTWHDCQAFAEEATFLLQESPLGFYDLADLTASRLGWETDDESPTDPEDFQRLAALGT